MLKSGGVEAREGQVWWVAWPDLEWSDLEQSRLEGQGHEAREGPKLERSGQRERLELEGEWSNLEGRGWTLQEVEGGKLRGHEACEGQREGLKLEGHEAGEGQRERLKLEGQWSNLEGPGSERQRLSGEKLQGHEAGDGPKLEGHEAGEGQREGPKLMHEDPKSAELEQGLAGHEWPEVSALAGDAGGGEPP
ncbi:hypothetical protein GCM10017784_33860 [Deinococcus indicus]|nr:hypothetical protein GCM10017784_33860 [Deinococcus indicus]